MIQLEISIPVLIYFLSLCLITLILGFCSILLDPTDPNIKQPTGPFKRDIEINCDKIYECVECKSVVSSTSKHCYDCGKCIKGFDHHCVWLNKCIGYNNYRVFFACIISYTIYNSTFLGIILMIIIKFSDYSDFENVEVIVCQVFLSALMIFFHSSDSTLCCSENKMSTYEYIKRNSKVDVDKTDLHGQSKLKILLLKNNDSFNKVQYVSIIKFRDDKLQFDDNSGYDNSKINHNPLNESIKHENSLKRVQLSQEEIKDITQKYNFNEYLANQSGRTRVLRGLLNHNQFANSKSITREDPNSYRTNIFDSSKGADNKPKEL